MKFPKVDDLIMPNIIHRVEAYFDSALRLLKITDKLILQLLNSPDSVKE